MIRSNLIGRTTAARAGRITSRSAARRSLGSLASVEPATPAAAAEPATPAAAEPATPAAAAEPATPAAAAEPATPAAAAEPATPAAAAEPATPAAAAEPATPAAAAEPATPAAASPGPSPSTGITVRAATTSTTPTAAAASDTRVTRISRRGRITGTRAGRASTRSVGSTTVAVFTCTTRIVRCPTTPLGRLRSDQHVDYAAWHPGQARHHGHDDHRRVHPRHPGDRPQPIPGTGNPGGPWQGCPTEGGPQLLLPVLNQVVRGLPVCLPIPPGNPITSGNPIPSTRPSGSGVNLPNLPNLRTSGTAPASPSDRSMSGGWPVLRTSVRHGPPTVVIQASSPRLGALTSYAP